MGNQDKPHTIPGFAPHSPRHTPRSGVAGSASVCKTAKGNLSRAAAFAGKLSAILLLSACSTTKNLPEGQILYTGQKSLLMENESKSGTGTEAMSEIDAALAKAPNNSLFGSSTTRHPFAFGLWSYNAFVNSEGGLGKWMFKKLASNPVYISTVNPGLRAKLATNILRDYGYFDGTVDYTLLPDKKNEKKAKIRFHGDMRNPYFLDSIAYINFPDRALRIINPPPDTTGRRRRGPARPGLLRKGDQFSVIHLESERQRISTALRNRGYYFFRPDYVGYRADTTRVKYSVDLRVMPKPGLPPEAQKQWYIGDMGVDLYGVHGEVPNDSILFDSLKIRYHKKLKVRPKVLKKQLRMKSGQLYSQNRSSATQQRFAGLGIFRYAEMQYMPRDTVSSDNLLDLTVKAGFDLPYDSEFEVNMATKSNDYAGPGMAYGITKRNVFKGGETFSVRVKGSYEWQTKSSPEGNNTNINSYEAGLTTSLAFPHIVFPRMGGKEWNFPATTTFGANVNLLNRPKYFRMLSFGGDVVYDFRPNRTNRHSITPFRLTFNVLQHTTDELQTAFDKNPALAKSMENQFIPAMNYTYTYDNGTLRRRRSRFSWQGSFTSAGNVTSALYSLSGKKFDEEKTLMGASLAQFLKLTSEVRYTWLIDRNQSIATRLYSGIVYAYGSKDVAPYTEQFYVGGANSIRAYTIRTIGPGSHKVDAGNRYAYLDQVGDIRLEANVEYRFRIIKNLHGALFVDAGNVWLLRHDDERPDGKFSLNNLKDNIALGTGAGLRYDFSFLVIRLDCGIGLHLPYETTRSGYYNIPKFKDGMGWHLAVGYPF